MSVWPQYLVLGITAFGLFCYALADGMPRTGKISFATQLVGSALNLWLLWCGGFFDVLTKGVP